MVVAAVGPASPVRLVPWAWGRDAVVVPPAGVLAAGEEAQIMGVTCRTCLFGQGGDGHGGVLSGRKLERLGVIEGAG
jgi:hypothetical protein